LKKFIYILFLSLIYGLTFSQENNILDQEFNLTEAPATFYDTIVSGLEDLNPSIRAKKVTHFTKLWTVGLIPRQQDTLSSILKSELEKGAKWSGALEKFLDQLYIATIRRSFSTEAIDNILETDKKVFQMADKKDVEHFFKKSASFLETRVIHEVGSFEIKVNDLSNVRFDAIFDNYINDNNENTFELAPEVKPEEAPWAEIENQKEHLVQDDWDKIEQGDFPSEGESESVFDKYLTEENDIPTIDGIFATMKDVDLTFRSKHDSIVIEGVSGSYLYKNNYFIGKGGKFVWQQVGTGAMRLWEAIGIKENGSSIKHTVINTFEDFAIDLDDPYLKFPNSTIDYEYRLKEPVKGEFTYLVRNKGIINYKYPRFTSYTNNAEFLNLPKGQSMKGGFKVIANLLFAETLDGTPSYFSYKDDKHSFKLEGKSFEITDSLIRSDYSKSSIHYKRDSITHKGTYSKFDVPNNSLTLIKNKKTDMRYSPYRDTYHDMEINVDKLHWSFADSTEKISFTNFYAREVREASFRSNDFFREKDYIQLKGIYKFHPLQIMTHYYYSKRKKQFTVGEIADYSGIKESFIRYNLVNLEAKHLLEYNPTNDIIELTKKGRKWALSSKKKVDYDQLEIISLSPIGYAGEMDMESGILKVLYVEDFNISDSLEVQFSLKDSIIEIDQNKNLLFAGEVKTSMEQFSGSSFRFNYDSFLVHMDTVNYIALSTEKADEDKTESDTENPQIDDEISEDRTLHKSSGILYLNAPNNKSSLGYLPQYPYFESLSGAYVFFSGKNVINGSYDKKVYFYIPPFGMDSLSEHGVKEITFEGDFITDNILPDMKEELSLMEDRSLGIKNKIPSGGFPVYTNKGRVTGNFSMDKQGLRVDGIYKYLNTTAKSNDFLLLQDSIVTNGPELTVAKGMLTNSDEKVLFPDLKVHEYRMVMKKQKDEISVSNLKESFRLYDNQAKLNGSVKITKHGVSGKGILETYDTRALSSSFDFDINKFTSRNTKFEVPSEDPTRPAMNSDNVKLTFDLKTKTAEFFPEIIGDATNSFPLLSYETSLYHGTWDILKETITFDKGNVPTEADTIVPFFRSTRKDQDFMTIYAKSGTYYKDSLKLEILGVEKMNISGAIIYPQSEKVIVRENAELDELRNAKIEMDDYHTLYEANLKVSSSSGFDGEASYDYKNNVDQVFPLSFKGFNQKEEILPDSTTTYMLSTNAEISEEDKFFIQKDMQFKGTATIYSKKKNLGFDGYIKPNIKGAVRIENWMRYQTDGNEDMILISLDSLKNEEEELLSNGIFFSGIEDDLYYKMVSPKELPQDRLIFDASGYLNYNSDEGIMRIGAKDRINGKSNKGNLMTYDEKKSIITFDGVYNMANIEDSANVKFMVSGKQDFNTRNTTYEVKALSKLSFNIPDFVYNQIAFKLSDIADIKGIKGEGEKIDGLYRRGIKLIDDSLTIEDISSTGLPLYLTHRIFQEGFLFSDITLKWSSDYNTWHNTGETVIANIGNTEIDAKFTTYLEVINWADGDVINLYIEAGGGSVKNWYYFSYKEQENSLTIVSSEKEINDTFYTKKRKAPKKGQMMYILGTELDKDSYVDKFKTNYLGYTLDQLLGE